MTKLALGTAAIGRPQYINIRQEESTTRSFDKVAFKEEGLKVLNKAYDLGIRYFDTAPGYGLAEELVLEWLKSKNDPSIEVATKWGYTYTANFDPQAEVHEVKEHNLSKLQEQWEVSQNLQPHLTTYQIHSATLESGVLENEAVLQELYALKKAHGLHIGLTSSGANQLEILKKGLGVAIEGEQLFNVFQVTYNIFDQSLSTIAKELAAGDNRLIVKEAMANGRVFPNQAYSHYHKLYQILEQLAIKYSVGIDAIALRFCMDTLHPFAVLSGASTLPQVQENFQALSFTLSKEDVEELKDFLIEPENYWEERKKLRWN